MEAGKLEDFPSQAFPFSDFILRLVLTLHASQFLDLRNEDNKLHLAGCYATQVKC